MLAKSVGGGGVTIPAFRAHRNGVSQGGIVTSTFTKLRWTHEDFDTNGDFVPDADDSGGAAESRFTPTEAGIYALSLTVLMQSSTANKQFVIYIRKNGVVIAQPQETTVSSLYSFTVQAATIVEANGSTDYFDAYIFHDVGSDRFMFGEARFSYFEGWRVQ